eukprot:jgi/Antlo1/363/695
MNEVTGHNGRMTALSPHLQTTKNSLCICREWCAWECMCCVVSAHRTSTCVQTRVHSLCTSPTSVQSSLWTRREM